jgi:hypothetical protein
MTLRLHDLAVVALLAVAALPAPGLRHGVHQPSPPAYELVNALPALWQTMDEARGADDAVWLRAFRARAVSPHQRLYGLARGGLDDSSLVRYRRAIEARPALRAIADSLPVRVDAYWASFVRSFPETRGGAAIYLLPAPQSAIGGWYRPLPKRDVLVLGFATLASMSSDVDMAVFVHHEMMHLYHAQNNPEMREAVASTFMNRGDHKTALYELVWMEGLASHASRVLNPTAPTRAFMSDRSMQENDAARSRTARAFLDHLVSTDSATLDAYVYGASDAVPPRASYYIGMLLAERLGQRYSLAALARLHGVELRNAISSELRRIAEG